MANVGVYVKDPDEILAAGLWGIDWFPDLATGETISTVAVTIRNETDGTDATSTMCPDGGVIVSNRYTTQRLVAGTDENSYTCIHKVTTSGGSTFEDCFTIVARAN